LHYSVERAYSLKAEYVVAHNNWFDFERAEAAL
jgi:hypothetical protein